mmetsp:Transcript_36963/g.102704  ORF Transcript_36963/g.102704 Transcript_36963/m.102704 type:complete len:579 (-) Transcript_36963:41-1777(-)
MGSSSRPLSRMGAQACAWRGNAEPTITSPRHEGDVSAVMQQVSRDTLPRRFRRAVDLPTVLNLIDCHCWQNPAVAERDFNLSHEVDSIDYFLSHDWGSSPTLKAIALVLIFNATPAAAAAIVVGILVGCLEAAGALPLTQYPMRVGGQTILVRPGILSFHCGLLTYAVFLVFWQRLRALLAPRPIMVFLDRLCIDRNNMSMKNAGIFGLAGILKDTQVMVILWSPQYCSRLWCMYEVATWFMNGNLGRSRRTIFMPLRLAGFCVACTLASLVAALIRPHVLSLVPQAVTPLFVVSIVSIDMLTMWEARGLVRGVLDLPQQVSSFSIENSHCGCCDLDHRLPDGTTIPCDRELIVQTLEAWMVDALPGTDARTSALSQLLSEHISEQLSPMAYLSSGRTFVSYSLILKTLVIPQTLCWMPWITVFWHLGGAQVSLRVLGEIVCALFCYVPTQCHLTLLVATLCESRIDSPFAGFAMTAWKTLLLEACSWIASSVQTNLTVTECPWPQFAMSVFMVMLTCVLFCSCPHKNRFGNLQAHQKGFSDENEVHIPLAQAQEPKSSFLVPCACGLGPRWHGTMHC